MSSLSSSPRNNTPEKVAAPLSTLSTKVDPLPHFGLAALSLGAAAYSYTLGPPSSASTNTAMAAQFVKSNKFLGLTLGLAGIGYGFSGFLLKGNQIQHGNDDILIFLLISFLCSIPSSPFVLPHLFLPYPIFFLFFN